MVAAVSRSVEEPTGPIAGGVRLLVACRSGTELSHHLEGSEVVPVAVDSSEAALHAAQQGAVDAAIVDDPALVDMLRAAQHDMPIVMLAPHGSAPSSKANATLQAPADAASLLHCLRRVMVVSYSDDDPVAEVLLGTSRSMQRVRQLIERSAPGIATILVRGETGTGKELVARAIHQRSERAAGPLVTIHCGALPDALLESELFGYERGAFTGAAERRQGRVELAAGGTLFLDEIGDITQAVQVKLLRLLQAREFQRLGSNDTLKADVRFVAATHRDLDTMVKEGSFRQDLFYRLNVVPLWVPPLRARRGDVALLARHFCELFAKANNRQAWLADDAVEQLAAKRWPGNVRQLMNFIERLVVLSGGGSIGAADVDRELGEGSPFQTDISEDSSSISIATRVPSPGATVVPLDEAVRKAERNALLAALAAAGNNRSQAARLLGISRATLYNKLKTHALP